MKDIYKKYTSAVYSQNPDRMENSTKPLCGYFESIKSGIKGFVFLFTAILLSKSLSYLLGTASSFSINISDIIISTWGFIGLSFINFASKNRITK